MCPHIHVISKPISLSRSPRIFKGLWEKSKHSKLYDIVAWKLKLLQKIMQEQIFEQFQLNA